VVDILDFQHSLSFEIKKLTAMKFANVFIFITSLFFSGSSIAQNTDSQPKVTDIQKEISLIKTTDYILKNFGDSIWNNISATPLRILLITDSLEFLFNHDTPDKSFKFYQHDSHLNTDIYVRPKRFPKFLRAAFPAVGGVDCIVVGIPKNTGYIKNTPMSDEDWIMMVLHEHFHVYQGANSQYKKNKAILEKKLSANSNNWMLDYNFPYDNKKVNEIFKRYSQSICQTLKSQDKDDLKDKRKQYLNDQKKLHKYLTSNDYSYLQFQIWQEGVATYTQYRYFDFVNRHNRFFKETYALDFKSKDKEFLKTYEDILLKKDLQKSKRKMFYSVGLLRGVINDKINPNWRKDYFETLTLE